jgi:hypothetical protein
MKNDASRQNHYLQVICQKKRKKIFAICIRCEAKKSYNLFPSHTFPSFRGKGRLACIFRHDYDDHKVR